jgi:hypothetical protein
MSKDRQECDAHVHACTQSDPGHGHVENRVIDIEKEHSKAREE